MIKQKTIRNITRIEILKYFLTGKRIFSEIIKDTNEIYITKKKFITPTKIFSFVKGNNENAKIIVNCKEKKL